MNINRRNFIQRNCAAIGTASISSTLFSLRMTAGATTNVSGYKALVCLFLNGGNDSYNMLIPYTNDNNGYQGYSSARGGVGTDANGFKSNSAGARALAINRSALSNTVLNNVNNQPSSQYAIHPRFPFLQQQFNQGNLSFVANVGTMVEPLTIQDWRNVGTSQQNKEIPVGLFSHPDAVMHWQTVVPQVRGATPKGWGGRLADVMSQANLNGSVGLNISLAGNNTLQLGNLTVPYVTTPNGAITLNQYSDNSLKNAVDSILANSYPNMYNKTFSENKKRSVELAEIVKSAVDAQTLTQDVPNTTAGNDNKTANQLAGVLRVMKARNLLGMNRQIFFVERGGWDHHNELLDAQGGIPYPNSDLADGSNGLFYELNEALDFFWNEVIAAGLENDVVLFTVSDFGRTMTSNGKGTDHAWGGNQFVLGKSISNGGSLNGGEIFGQYPILDPNNNDLDLDAHKNKNRGRMLPTTSADAYLAELVSWFGLDPTQLSTVFPNCTKFFNPIANPHPLGMLG